MPVTIILQPNLSLLGSLRGQSLVLVSTHVLQPGRPLFGSLRGQSLVLVSTHQLQPGRPLFSSLRSQSLVLVSTHLLQPGRPLFSSLRSQSFWAPLPQRARSALLASRTREGGGVTELTNRTAYRRDSTVPSVYPNPKLIIRENSNPRNGCSSCCGSDGDGSGGCC